jgi:hypothetical protein
LVLSIQAIVRERPYVRWFDYVSLALGIAPFAFVVIARVLSS